MSETTSPGRIGAPTVHQWLEEAVDRLIRAEPYEIHPDVRDVRWERNDPDPANVSDLVDRRAGWTFTAKLYSGEEVEVWRP